MATVKKMKKAEDGTELRKGQYKRIGRIAERNPERAERVADRMKTRAGRVERGKEIANPPKIERNPMFEMQMNKQMKDRADSYKNKMKKGGVVKKAKMGGKITKKK